MDYSEAPAAHVSTSDLGPIESPAGRVRVFALTTGDADEGFALAALPAAPEPHRAIPRALLESELFGQGVAKLMSPRLPDSGLDLRNAVESFENQLIVQALERTKWNKKQAASLLGLNRTTLVEMLKRKGITPPRRQTAPQRQMQSELEI